MIRRCLFYQLVLVFLFVQQGYAQQACGFDQLHQQRLKADPLYRQQVQLLEAKLHTIKERNSGNLGTMGFTDTIPVVVHVVHTGGAVGSKYNPSDSTIQAAIAYTNRVYAGTWPGVRGAGDVGIRFVLAKRDPNCFPTNGIDRYDGRQFSLYENYGVNQEGNEAEGVSPAQLMKLSAWDPNRYYNIWLVNSIGTYGAYGAISGFAYFPLAASQDGLFAVSDGARAGNSLLVHELGHAFFLYHPFQGSLGGTCAINNECSTEGDEVCDTDPVTQFIGQGRTGFNSCSNSPYTDNTERNFMSYTCCNILFTEGQKQRMQLTGMNTTVRDTLRKSLGRFPPDTSSNCGSVLRLAGKLMERDVYLYWPGNTSSTNSYDLERSYDGINYTFIARISSRQDTQLYSFHDHDIPQSKDYYRLRQLGSGGVINYSNTVAIDLPINSDLPFHVLNNPVTTYIDMEIGNIPRRPTDLIPAYGGTAFIQLLDMQGRQLNSRQQAITANQRLRISVGGIPRGVYMMRVVINDVLYTKKILKL